MLARLTKFVVVSVVVCLLWGVVAVLAGPLALVAWIVAAAVWIIASDYLDIEDTTRSDLLASVLLLCEIVGQVALDLHERHLGDSVFVLANVAMITSRVRGNAFPRARARRSRCSNG